MANGIYISPDGKARKVKSCFIGINGVAHEIVKAYIGDENGVARLCWTAFDGDPVFANNTWEKIIDACCTRRVPSTWRIGDQKTMTIDGADYVIEIIGKNHDEYSDGSGKAPLTFQMNEYYKYVKGMEYSATNANGWTNCNIRKNELPALLKTMPSEVKAAVKQVNKLTSAGGQSSTINTTADKLFLLSEVEVFGTTTLSAVGEGSQYAYYKEGGSANKAHGTTVSDWWLRSPVVNSSAQFCIVDENGTLRSNNANSSQAIACAFCF
jgi:hypothetical protein